MITITYVADVNFQQSLASRYNLHAYSKFNTHLISYDTLQLEDNNILLYLLSITEDGNPLELNVINPCFYQYEMLMKVRRDNKEIYQVLNSQHELGVR